MTAPGDRKKSGGTVLKRIKAVGFKSLGEVEIDLPRMAVLFGPNAAGKSNLLDAVQALSRIATSRTLSDALSDPIRGYPIEAFSFPSGGLPALLRQESPVFALEADVEARKNRYRYRIEVEIRPGSGALTVRNEFLCALDSKGIEKPAPLIQRIAQLVHIRPDARGTHPRMKTADVNHSYLSDLQFSGSDFQAIEHVRSELSGWRTYYLDPRVAMRAAQPPSDVQDIGVLGGEIAPFLYRLRAEHPKHFQAISRALRSIVPSVEDLTVDLDERRGTLDILIRQAGVDYSSRIVSEGTLRVLALCAIAVNSWGGSLLAFEEPENGVHPRRLELIAQLLLSLALEQGRQVVVTTHSPLFCDAVLKGARSRPRDIGLFNVRREGRATVVRPFDVTGPLFKDREIAAALSNGTEDGLFESLVLRGLLDE